MAEESDQGGMSLLDQLKAGKITYSQYEAALKAQAEALKNKPKPLGKVEHVGLDQADREAKKRKKNHPTSGSTKSIPDRWSTTGTKPKKPGE
jgi:hypothetical protein